MKRDTQYPCTVFVFSIATLAYALMAGSAHATTRTKANNTTNLNLTGSWSAGVVPGSGDIALWDSTVTGANTVSLGADLNFGEIQITNPGGTVTINAGNTLTLSGVSGVGIDMSSASQNLFLNCAITLGAAQSWNVASGRNLVLFSTATLNTGGNVVNITGLGVTQIDSVISGTGGLTDTGASGNGGILFLDATNNSYTGVTKLDGGQTLVSALADVNVASSIGKGSAAGSAADLVFGGGVLYYSPSASTPTSTNRLFTIGDTTGFQLTATLYSDNSNPANTMSFTGTGAIAFGGSGPRSLNFSGNNTGNNTFAPILGDGTGGATSLQKFGLSTWILTGANTYSGGTNVHAGTLTVNTGGTIGASTGSLTVSNVFNTATVLNLNVDQTVGSLQGSISGTGSATINIANTKTLTVSQSTNTTYAGVIASAGSFTKSGTGTLTLSGANTYTGVTTISGGTLSVTTLANGGAASGIGQSTNPATNLVLNGGGLQYTGAAVSTDRLFSVGTAGGTLDSSGSGSVNFTNTGSMGFNSQTGARTLILTGTKVGNSTLAAVIGENSGATSLTKNGTGSWILTGTSTYTGATTINAGKLFLQSNNTTASILAGTSSVTVNSGGTLSLSQVGVTNNNRINNSATMTLNGGTFDTGGLQEHGATSNTAGIGALTLQSSSVIDMASGTSILAFANSSANSVAWGTGKSLDIWNWTGTPLTGGGTDQLYFGSDVTGLTASQLLEIHFYGGAGTGLYGGPTLILADGEVVPVPEPSTWVAAGLGLVALAFTHRRRLSLYINSTLPAGTAAIDRR